MNFIDGYIGLLSAISGGGAFTEIAASRQPISFSTPRALPLDAGMPVGAGVVSVNAQPFSFGFAKTGPFVGYGVFDAPTGGNAMLLAAFAGPRQPPGGGPTFSGQVGHLSLVFADAQGFDDAAAWSASYGAGAALGTAYDSSDIIGRGTVTPAGRYVISYTSGALTVGPVPIIVNRGVLQTAARWPL